MRRFFAFSAIIVVIALFSAKSFESDQQLIATDSLTVLEPKDYYDEETELINTIITRYH